MTENFTVVVEKEAEGGYHAYCPILPGCRTDGETIEEVLMNIREAIELYLETLSDLDRPIPSREILVSSIPVAV